MTDQSFNTVVHRLLSTKEVLQITGQSKSTHFARQNINSPSFEPEYPKGIRISARSVRYSEQEVIAWISKKMEDRA